MALLAGDARTILIVVVLVALALVVIVPVIGMARRLLGGEQIEPTSWGKQLIGRQKDEKPKD